MASVHSSAVASGSRTLRARVVLVMAVVLALHATTAVGLSLAAPHYPLLPGLALIAYSLGLRHAVDADHIAAIDNATRRLLLLGQQPAALGLFFSLGHSTVVLALTLLMGLSAGYLDARFPALRELGSSIGSMVSTAFLLALGLWNLAALRQLLAHARSRPTAAGLRGVDPSCPSGEPSGILGSLLQPLLRLVDRSWKLYVVGVLFGLGFDTATEIALLGLAAGTAADGLPLGALLLLPLAFTSAMTLVDSLNGILVLRVYGWAHTDPGRKLYYNLTVTLISGSVALLIGIAQALDLIGRYAGPESLPAELAGRIGVEQLGIALITLLPLSWLASLLLNRRRTTEPPGP